ncbi:hypothetical protein Q31a_10360 [Aureliella helgolandensis]|uniref:Uncharacterized protein n=1 Tax=Aureliella helgolandensis TaxID=2527968 RepID=A0A518G2G4_9BACT|nr:hypothetical protein Q31a_10360 [Aureliella helgolandensis]
MSPIDDNGSYQLCAPIRGKPGGSPVEARRKPGGSRVEAGVEAEAVINACL